MSPKFHVIRYLIFCCKSKDFFWLLLVSETPFLSSSIFFKQIIINSTNYWPWISSATSENLEFNESSWYFIFSFIVLICMSGNVLKLAEVIFSRNKLFVTSESERVNENFGVEEKSIWILEKSWKIVSEEWDSPLFISCIAFSLNKIIHVSCQSIVNKSNTQLRHKRLCKC